MVEPIQPTRTEQTHGLPKGVSSQDVQVHYALNSQKEALGEALSTAKGAQQSQISSSPNTQPSAPQTYIDALQQALALLKKDGLPTDYLNNALSALLKGTPPYPTNFTSSVSQLFYLALHEANTLPPNLREAFTTEIKTSFGKALPAAENSVSSLQKEIAALEKEMGPANDALKAIHAIEGDLKSYLSNPQSADYANALLKDILTLSSLYGKVDADTKSLINDVFNTLSQINSGQGGLIDEMAALRFLNAAAKEGAEDRYADWSPTKAMQEAAVPSNGIPFLQSMNSVIQGMLKHNEQGRFNMYNYPVWDSGLVPTGGGSGRAKTWLDSAYAQKLVKAFSFPSSSVNEALSTLDQEVKTYTGGTHSSIAQQIQALQDQLKNAQALVTVFSEVKNGEFSKAFPNGPPLVGPASPKELDATIALEANLLGQALWNAPSSAKSALAPLWNDLYALTAGGPPYAAHTQQHLAVLAESLNALSPFTPAQKEAFQKLEQSIQSQLSPAKEALSQQSASLAQTKAAAQAIDTLILNKPGSAGWEKAAHGVQTLVQIHATTTNSSLKEGIEKIDATLGAYPSASTDLGHALFYTELSRYSGQPTQRAKEGMERFVNTFLTTLNAGCAHVRTALQENLTTWEGEMFSTEGGHVALNPSYLDKMHQEPEFTSTIQEAAARFTQNNVAPLEESLRESAHLVEELESMQNDLNKYS